MLKNSLRYFCQIELSEIFVVVRPKQMFQFVQYDKFHKLNTDDYLFHLITIYLTIKHYSLLTFND